MNREEIEKDRVKTYLKLSEEFNIDSDTIGHIFTKGIEYALSKQKQPNKSAEELEKKLFDLIYDVFHDNVPIQSAVDVVMQLLEEYSKQSNWISVKDRLPEENEEILIYSKTLAKTQKEKGIDLKPMTCYYNDGFKHFYSKYQKVLDSIEVTHWQPLPQPPKQ